ncbi:MAG: FAD-dependent oxidoreductase, partial [Spirochaetales bacterium]
MASNDWKDIAASEDITDGSFVSVQLSEEESVLLVRTGTELHAWADACPHVGCPMSNGHLADGVLTCPCHNARFDAATGSVMSPPALDDLPRYEVKEENGRVSIGARQEVSFPVPTGADSRTVAIVGAGAAGALAAEQLRREGFGGRIIMITPEAGRPYDRVLLSKFYLAGEMGFDDIALRPASFYERQKIELRTGRSATGVDADNRRITLDNGEQLQADFIVLATGSRAKTPPIAGIDLKGVHLLRNASDAEAIREEARNANNIVVIGASFIGTEVAAYLRARGLNVAIVAPEEVPFERSFGVDVGTRFATMHRDAGVGLHLGRGVERIAGDGRVDRVELDDGSSLPADLVVIGTGAEPVVDYLEDSGLLDGGAVPVDGQLRTAKSGVYAVGDIARVEGPDGAKRVEHWVVAQRHGRQAARSIVGKDEPLPFAPFFWTRQFETSFGYYGYAPDFDEVRFKGDVKAGKFLAGYFKDGILRAVGTIGKGKTALRYGLLLDAGRRISVDQFE